MNSEEKIEEITQWWLATSEKEIRLTIPKAIEYGADDLREIGRALIKSDDDSLCAQAGIAFYALGKIHRILSAVDRGEHPSYDSWFDLGVYAKMAQRVQDMGGWPGSPDT